MTISGFTIIKNAVVFDFPVVESIKSMLELVDEFVIVMGDNTDATAELIHGINSPKIKIINTVWDTKKYNKHGMIYAYQTDLALKACTGDWCFYIQADEVLHEGSVDVIRRACSTYLDKPQVEGFILKYVHFYGHYRYYIDALHFAYPREIRIVRNSPDIHSWRDAQSFRVIPNFDYEDYCQMEGTRKLKCVLLNAYMYHYGWCRNPYAMLGKYNEQVSVHYGEADKTKKAEYKNYGNLSYMPTFKGSHPKVMRERISKCNWEELLRHTGPKPDIRKKFHLKYRILTFIEQRFLNGTRIGGFNNFEIVGRFR